VQIANCGADRKQYKRGRDFGEIIMNILSTLHLIFSSVFYEFVL